MVLAWAMAWIVYRTRPDRAQNRRLALVLFFEGTAWGTGGGLLYFTTRRPEAFGVQAVFYVCLLALPWLYLRFIATLETPLVKFLRARFVDWVLIAASALVPLVYFFRRTKFTVDIVPTWYARNEAVLGPYLLPTLWLVGLASLFAMVAAFHALRRVDSIAGRRRAKAFALAFGTRDALFVLLTFAVPVFAPLPPSGTWTDMIYVLGSPVITLLFVILATYGILHAHLFDIDLKIKRGAGRGIALASVAAGFFVVSETTEALLPIDGLLPGLLAAAALALAFLPLQRASARLLDRLMPATRDTPEYRRRRKKEVYQAAFEELSRDGRLSAADRKQLAALRSRLGLPTSSA